MSPFFKNMVLMVMIAVILYSSTLNMLDLCMHVDIFIFNEKRSSFAKINKIFFFHFKNYINNTLNISDKKQTDILYIYIYIYINITCTMNINYYHLQIIRI